MDGGLSYGPKVDTVPALGFSFRAAVGDGREIVMQSHVVADATADELNRMLDKCSAAIHRQVQKQRLVDTKEMLRRHEATAVAMEKQMAQVEANARTKWAANESKRGPFKMTPAEDAQKKVAETNLHNLRTDVIPRTEADIAALEEATK